MLLIIVFHCGYQVKADHLIGLVQHQKIWKVAKQVCIVCVCFKNTNLTKVCLCKHSIIGVF